MIQCIEAPYKLTHLHYCQMEQLENGIVGLNASITIPKVLNFIEVSAKLFYKYTTYRPFMIDWSIEFCQTYRAGRFNPSAAVMLKVIETTLPQYYYSCPHGCIDAPYKLTHLNYCQMEQLQNGTVGLNVSVSIPIVLNYIEVSAKLFYKYTTYRPFMIDWSIEFCQTYRAGKFNPSAALILKVVEETLPLYYYSCPHGNRTYSALWLFGSQFIPEALPSGNYRMDIRLRDSTNTVLIASRIYGAVRKQGLIG
uniref:Uncharacterized protein n=1 Tax=Anopheles culicifacies TaxID=139723 RepID=A0A182MKB5_9DIPT